MSSFRTTSRQAAVSVTPMRWLTHLAFILALVVLIARITTPDALRDPWETAPGGEALPSSPGPGTALVLDLLACLPALLVLGRRSIDRSYRLLLLKSHPLLFALAGWMVLSVSWSSDRFAAAVNSAHFFAAACLLWAMSQLVRSAARFRVVSALAFGLLLLLVVQSALYRYIDVAANINYWNEHKTEILQEHQWVPDSFPARQFEHKLVAGELVGFFNSANTFAAVGVLLFAGCVGIGFQKLRDREPRAWLVLPAVSALALIWILVSARSKTAAATPVLGVAAVGAFILLRRRFTPKKHNFHYWTGVSLVALVMLAVVGHGMYHHGLFPGHFSNSLDFRWKYWIASVGIFVTHPWVGVGWSNFGLHYLAHRLPDAAEEIKDPHNFLVRFFVELGLIGGLLSIGWLLRVAWEITRPASRTEPAPDSEPLTIKSVAVVVIIGMLISVLANTDFSMSTGDTITLLLRPVLYFLALLLGSMAAAMLSQHSWSLDNRPAGWVFYCTVIGLGLFLLHNLIDFSWFEPGAMFLFMMMVGSTAGMSVAEGPETKSRLIPTIGLFAAACGWLVVAVFFVGPILMAEQASADANESIRTATTSSTTNFQHAGQALAEAYRLVPYNSDYCFREAEIRLRLGDLSQAKQLLAQTKKVNPLQLDAYLLEANLELSRPDPDVNVVRSDFSMLLRSNPNDVSLHVRYGDALMRFGFPQEAREQYRLALAADNALAVGEPKRLSAEQVSQLRAKAMEFE